MCKPFILNVLMACMIALVASTPARASYAIFVGKNLTADGATLLGGTGDEPSSHWLDIVPRKTHPAGTTIRVGVDSRATFPGELIIEKRLRQATSTGRLSLRQFMDTVRDPLISGDQNGYGQVAALRPGVSRPEMHLLWVAATGSITAPFVPYWVGNERVLPEYGKHRYLSARESEGLVTKDFQIQEASQFACVTFKRLMYYTCDKPEKFLPEVTEALTAFENESIAAMGAVERQANTLFAAGEAGLAREALTNYSNQRAMDALHLGESLLGSIEVRHRLLYGYRAPQEGQMSQSEDDREALVGCGKVLPWD